MRWEVRLALVLADLVCQGAGNGPVPPQAGALRYASYRKLRAGLAAEFLQQAKISGLARRLKSNSLHGAWRSQQSFSPRNALEPAVAPVFPRSLPWSGHDEARALVAAPSTVEYESKAQWSAEQDSRTLRARDAGLEDDSLLRTS